MVAEKQVARTEEEPMVPEEYGSSGENVFTPPVDIVERGDSVVILADMPGVTRESLDVIYEEGVLKIDGKVECEEEEDLELQREEYETGDYRRRFTVGEGLNVEEIDATMRDGVLRIEIPKAETYQRRRIEIKGE